MRALRWPIVCGSLIVLATFARGADPAPTDADITVLVRKLDAKNT
jgi:hypothetical protein